jgi:hypothetical protein
LYGSETAERLHHFREHMLASLVISSYKVVTLTDFEVAASEVQCDGEKGVGISTG